MMHPNNCQVACNADSCVCVPKRHQATDEQMALAYYRAVTLKLRPEFVPETVKILQEVRSSLPFSRAAVYPGVAGCSCNPWGAVTVKASDKSMLGLLPAEYEPLTWRAA